MSTALKKRTARRKKLLDLEPNDCRWPIGEPRTADFHFCGAPHAPGRPYCQHHWDLAFQPPRPRNLGRQEPRTLAIVPPAAAKAA